MTGGKHSYSYPRKCKSLHIHLCKLSERAQSFCFRSTWALSPNHDLAVTFCYMTIYWHSVNIVEYISLNFLLGYQWFKNLLIFYSLSLHRTFDNVFHIIVYWSDEDFSCHPSKSQGIYGSVSLESQSSWAWWHIPVILALGEAEAGGLLWGQSWLH